MSAVVWTQEEINQLKAAILALASGEKAATVRYDGPPARSVTYHPVNLGEMRKLLSSMVADSTGSARRVTLARHSKGLR